MKIKCLIVVFVFLFLNTKAQRIYYEGAKNMKTKNMVEIPELVNENIPGAVKLGQPIHIQGINEEIITEKHGYAFPSLFDWNKDGLNDLLIGEFKTGDTGSNVQVHLNIGTNEFPKFSGSFQYAKDINGNNITANYWCCIGFHPRFFDLTGDGIKDLITGSYNPGIISMWEGTKNGFKSVVEIEQLGNPRGTLPGIEFTNPASDDYFTYTSVDFADYNNDGLYDAFIGGCGGLRVALNVGTKMHPKFGLRKPLLDPEGNLLRLVDNDHYKHMSLEAAKNGDGIISGDFKSYVTPVDWDNDGVIDLLATSSYAYKDQNPVEFFKGVRTNKGIRFLQKQPLFKRKDGYFKSLPGSGTQIQIVDYNNDGIKDLLLGISILSVKDYQMIDSLAWTSLDDLQLPRIGKDLGAGYADIPNYINYVEQEDMMKKMNSSYKPRWYYQGDLNQVKKDILGSRHRGYVYVMLGEKALSKGIVEQFDNAKDFKLPDVFVAKGKKLKGKKNGPVEVVIEASESYDPYSTPAFCKVKFKLKPGWYLYANTDHNTNSGYITTKVEFETKDGVKKIGDVKIPTILNPNGVATYQGNDIEFIQYFSKNEGDIEFSLKISYQTCNQLKCLPPVSIKEDIKIKYKSLD